MLALLFEVTPIGDGYDQYLRIAASLRPLLDKNDGLLFIDRYAKMQRPDAILSHSLWRDEASLTAWRTDSAHHKAQVLGREKIFADYRLRIAQVVAEGTCGKAVQIPARLTSYRDTTVHPPRFLAIAASHGAVVEGPGGSFASLSRPGEHLYLEDVESRQAGETRTIELIANPAVSSVRLCEVERDYGMFNRTEAPQYYPPVTRGVQELNEPVQDH